MQGYNGHSDVFTSILMAVIAGIETEAGSDEMVRSKDKEPEFLTAAYGREISICCSW